MAAPRTSLLLLLFATCLWLHKCAGSVLQQVDKQAFATDEEFTIRELQGNVSEKVSLELYYETLCPYSADFIVNFLDKIFTNGLISIVHLRLIPYGNARATLDGSIVCQHGPYECKLNLIETCVINLWPIVSQYFPFIYCVESLVLQQTYEAWPSCVEESALDLASILDCYNSPWGMKFQLDFAAETNELDPPHEYVPWVVVNGQPLYEDYEDVGRYVCEAYLGPKPDACTNINGTLSNSTKRSKRKFSLNEPLYDSISF